MPQAGIWVRLWPCAALQALIVRWVPILGPIVGSAFIIGLYMLSRLVKGDLTDRLKMMSQVGKVESGR